MLLFVNLNNSHRLKSTNGSIYFESGYDIKHFLKITPRDAEVQILDHHLTFPEDVFVEVKCIDSDGGIYRCSISWYNYAHTFIVSLVGWM